MQFDDQNRWYKWHKMSIYAKVLKKISINIYIYCFCHFRSLAPNSSPSKQTIKNDALVQTLLSAQVQCVFTTYIRLIQVSAQRVANLVPTLHVQVYNTYSSTGVSKMTLRRVALGQRLPDRNNFMEQQTNILRASSFKIKRSCPMSIHFYFIPVLTFNRGECTLHMLLLLLTHTHSHWAAYSLRIWILDTHCSAAR